MEPSSPEKAQEWGDLWPGPLPAYPCKQPGELRARDPGRDEEGPMGLPEPPSQLRTDTPITCKQKAS